jgi:hypothetical protein
MKNYRIIEDRPVLSIEQVKQGMNFDQIVNGTALIKKLALKSLLIKGISVVVITTSGFVAYKTIQDSRQKSNPVKMISVSEKPIVMESPVPSSNDAIPDPENKNTVMPAESTAITTIMQQEISDKKDTALQSGGLIQIIESNPVINSEMQVDEVEEEIYEKIECTDHLEYDQCLLLNTTDLCDFPATERSIISIDCNNCNLEAWDCATASEKKLKGVWLTIYTDKNESLQIESHFNNIKLIRSGTDLGHPQLMKIGGQEDYWNHNLKAKNLTINYRKQIDLFFFFEDVQEEDEIVIKNLVRLKVEN